MISLYEETVETLRFASCTIAIVYVRTAGFDLQNDMSEGDHKLFKGRKCSARARKVAEQCVLYARRGAGTRFLYQDAVVVVVILVVPACHWSFALVEMDLRRPGDISCNATYGPSVF